MLGALLGGGLSVVGGLIKTGGAKKREKALESEIAKYPRQKLTNIADGLGVSTLGADRAMELSNIATATSLDALSKSGTRALLGGVGAVNAASNATGRKIQADLDARQKEIDRVRAEDEARIRGIREEREKADLAGLGNALNAARQDRASGIHDIFSGITGMGTAGLGGLFGSNASPAVGIANQNTASSLTPVGMTGSTAGALGGLDSVTPLFSGS